MKLKDKFSDELVLLDTLTVPILMNKNRMCSINNWATMHWSIKSKLKNEYKALLENWFLDGKILPEDCFFVWEPAYKDKRKHDSLNQASICKIIEDTFVKVGSLPDDDKTNHILMAGAVDKSLINHQIKVQIFGKKD